jgi:hypothetical protein
MNAQLIKLTEERIDSNTALSTFVQKAKEITIPLFPQTVQFTDPALKFGAAVVSVSTQLDSYGNNRDIYKNESGGFCLHLSKLNEIAQQAGIQIIDSRILERKVDETGRVTFINHQVRGRMKSIDGSVKEVVTTGKYDYFRDVESLGKGDPNNKQVKGRRKHAEALAESNAITRVYNKLIAQIPTNFTLDELKKPFLIPFVIEDKDALLNQLPEDERKEVVKELVRKRLGIADQIYGAPAQQIENANVVTIIDDEPETPTPPQVEGLTIEQKNRIIAKEFEGTSQAERTEKIINLVKITGYTDPNGVAITASRIEKQLVENQINFLERLLNLQSTMQNEEAPL